MFSLILSWTLHIVQGFKVCCFERFQVSDRVGDLVRWTDRKPGVWELTIRMSLLLGSAVMKKWPLFFNFCPFGLRLCTMRKRQRGLGVVTLGLFLAFHRKALPALVVEDGALILIISSGKLLSWKSWLITKLLCSKDILTLSLTWVWYEQDFYQIRHILISRFKDIV